MFNADELTEGLPLLETRQALIVLDLQNDFLSPKSRLPVTKPEGFLSTLKKLVPAFRQKGDIIWVRTEFETERPISQDGESDSVITDQQLLRHARDSSNAAKQLSSSPGSSSAKTPGTSSDRSNSRSKKVPPGSNAKLKSNRADSSQSDGTLEHEAFLTKSPSGRQPRICLPRTIGVAFADPFGSMIDENTDSTFVKSHYSAFRSTALLPHLRGNLVTTLFVCGIISNVSVLATTLDAARHGYSITLVEDCLGYRDEARHVEALRQMTEYAGAEVINSAQLFEEIKSLEKKATVRTSKGSTETSARAAGGVNRTLMSGNMASRRSIPVKSSQAKWPAEQSDDSDSASGGEKLTADSPVDNLHAKMSGFIEPGDSANFDQEEDGGTGLQDMRHFLQMARRSPTSKRTDPQASADDSAQISKDPPGKPDSKPKADGSDGNAGTSSDLNSNVAELHAKLKGTVETSDERTQADGAEKTLDLQEYAELARQGLPFRESGHTCGAKDSSLVTRDSGNVSNPPDSASPAMQIAQDGAPEARASTLQEAAAAPLPKSSEPSSLPPLQTSPSLEKDGKGTVPQVRPVRAQRNQVRGPSISTLGPDDQIGEGDCRLVPDLLPAPLKNEIFVNLKEEVNWKTMLHRGGEVPRLVAVQGDIADDGSFPVYRHPADQSPLLSKLSPTVLAIKREAEKNLGHPLNHVLIQLYRHGNDYISEHSDKTLDIVRGSSIVNVSLGAQRTMTLRTKRSPKPPSKPDEVVSKESEEAHVLTKENFGKVGPVGDQAATERNTQRILMPHNSMFVLGQASNMRWLHGIRPDKRPTATKEDEERAFGGERISLTFRHIGTFLDKSSKHIWGQGATSKRVETATPISNDSSEAERMINAFGSENQQSEFDWDTAYGTGFDTLHLPTRPTPKLFICGDPLADTRVKLYLAESGIEYEPGIEDLQKYRDTALKEVQTYRLIRFIDNDNDKTEVGGVLPILMYLEFYHRNGGDINQNRTRPEVGEMFTRMGQSNDLLNAWRVVAPVLTRSLSSPPHTGRTDRPDSDDAESKFDQEQKREADRLLASELKLWDGIAARNDYIGGRIYSMADAAIWPVLREIVLLAPATLTEERFPTLMTYYHRVEGLESSRRVLSPQRPGEARKTLGGDHHL
ncbi:MAG: hypothetical protein M4579_002690 [Chaenotheca gracillima]|nr:MAG: hypothetical protein M4579_002690 [Chaenotheca gracillima]